MKLSMENKNSQGFRKLLFFIENLLRELHIVVDYYLVFSKKIRCSHYPIQFIIALKNDTEMIIAPNEGTQLAKKKEKSFLHFLDFTKSLHLLINFIHLTQEVYSSFINTINQFHFGLVRRLYHLYD